MNKDSFGGLFALGKLGGYGSLSHRGAGLMKVSAPQTTKFMKLKRRLSIPHWQCVGLLESLWLFTQTNAPAGDIGRHSDEDIAASIEWSGEPAKLICELLECGWLDECAVNRLVVHDWGVHAPTYIKGVMARNGGDFVVATKLPTKSPLGSRKRTTKSPATPTSNELPSLAKPSLAKPSEASSLPAVAGGGSPDPPEPKPTHPHKLLFAAVAEVTGYDPETAKTLLGSVASALGKATPPFTPDDVREFARQFVVLCPHAAKDGRTRPEPKELQNHIGKLRNAAPKTANHSSLPYG